VAGPGGEELEHLFVGAPALAGEGVADQVGEVEIAHRDGVGVAEATIATSAEVQGPTPGRAWRRRWASAAGMDHGLLDPAGAAGRHQDRGGALRSTPSGWNAQ
jgi:hypothetical protein